MFLAVSIYGWIRWSRSNRGSHAGESGAITPEWASWRVRIALILAMILGTAALTRPLTAIAAGYRSSADIWHHRFTRSRDR
ncbi:nicotinamide mononucleotide transporter [Nesterenkonia sp. MY13]|uniref:Nicotinamide mononucleotide transporter n=2 Tax=Nesterenkonia sedimenti TaxID=1463632 RepID=A0A7X8YE46_9MICC|nr:nicotinamide mononucleotide transporter [Nesterenkonia sedimenti]